MLQLIYMISGQVTYYKVLKADDTSLPNRVVSDDLKAQVPFFTDYKYVNVGNTERHNHRLNDIHHTHSNSNVYSYLLHCF